jgi:hypothetical protein
LHTCSHVGSHGGVLMSQLRRSCRKGGGGVLGASGHAAMLLSWFALISHPVVFKTYGVVASQPQT